jgi:hypothetical protein
VFKSWSSGLCDAYSDVVRYQHFAGPCCLHRHGEVIGAWGLEVDTDIGYGVQEEMMLMYCPGI